MNRQPRSLSSLFTRGSIARLLKEEGSAHESGASGDSLDSQVDRYLAQYEGAAKVDDDVEPDMSVDQMESMDWRDLMKGFIISEAGEEDDDAAAESPEATPGTDDDSGKLGLEKLNVEAFANDVVRLIENYDNLLEVRNTLVRRARSFLEKSYNDEVLNAFEQTLRDDHGIEAGTSSNELTADKSKAPAADRANGSAAPGFGGGAAGGP